MLPIARMTDVHICPIHGPNAIIVGNPATTSDGLPIARIGDATACGATILLGSSMVFSGGMPVAYLGCPTSHGGVIASGAIMHTETP